MMQTLITKSRVRLRVLPSLLPTQIELRNNGGISIQWRYIDGVSDWEDLILVADMAPTAADLLALLLTVDGPGSGLDADTLDGLDSTAFQTMSQSVQVVTATGTTAVDAGTDLVVLNLASPGNVTLQLGAIADQNGRAVTITQWNTNATITVAADGGDAGGIKTAATIDLVPGTSVTFQPVTDLSGWTF